ncbi:hypothetical protein [Aphanothece sacrum]|uniref:WD40 repeat-containing protein n=1 Tax=Aphanothece sacrum FPU1 TaxID=1920663 RepID=A0A401ILP8_APHSA|nr:hypothetical protein [Aphanothece sacrum]GBF82172.1 WD40 repeat-containing protein [Aphanothece sacrum FPU1]
MYNYQHQVKCDRQQLKQEEQETIAKVERDFLKLKQEIERDRQQLKQQQQEIIAKVERDRQELIQQQQEIIAKVERDRQELIQQQQKIFLPVSYTPSPALSEGLLIDTQKDISVEGVGFVIGGALAGVSTSAMIGGMGLVGKFGGIGLGLGTMTATGLMIGAATYGALTAIIEEDTTALAAMGLGTLGGVGISATVGSMGLSVGGTAFALGMTSMAAAGGIIGLGIYGLTKIVSDGTRDSKIYRNLEFLATIIREYEDERKWADLESGYLGIDAELQALKIAIANPN